MEINQETNPELIDKIKNISLSHLLIQMEGVVAITEENLEYYEEKVTEIQFFHRRSKKDIVIKAKIIEEYNNPKPINVKQLNNMVLSERF